LRRAPPSRTPSKPPQCSRIGWSGQAFGEGNKRTALLLARWLLDRNGVDGAAVLPPDREFGDLLVRAAAGNDVESEIVALLVARRPPPSN
jgi:prophage maintenance system killer protein